MYFCSVWSVSDFFGSFRSATSQVWPAAFIVLARLWPVSPKLDEYTRKWPGRLTANQRPRFCARCAASGAARNPSSLSAHSSWLTKILPGQGVAAAGTRIGSLAAAAGAGPTANNSAVRSTPSIVTMTSLDLFV